jgi:hypothetical protein
MLVAVVTADCSYGTHSSQCLTTSLKYFSSFSCCYIVIVIIFGIIIFISSIIIIVIIISSIIIMNFAWLCLCILSYYQSEW